MAFFVLNIVYFLRVNMMSDKAIINSMINIDENLARRNLTIQDYDEYMIHNFDYNRAVMDNPDSWVFYDGFLFMYLVQKFVFTALTLSCDTPGGIFTPTFTFGAVFGQLYISIVIKILGFFQIPGYIQCKSKSFILTKFFS